ncbi:hypothetical protein TNCV_2674481 [Trichonephila clavipes]|nr:hypothetical protein TNCV_2674481 [Trichonephila clavipes]
MVHDPKPPTQKIRLTSESFEKCEALRYRGGAKHLSTACRYPPSREHSFLKLRSSVTIVYTTDRETTGNSNGRVVIVNILFSRISVSTACIKSSVITESRPERSSSWSFVRP